MSTTDQSQQPLNGQQIDAMKRQFGIVLAEIRKDIELRKLALDYAAKLCGEQLRTAPDLPFDPIGLARHMHDFLTDAAKEPT